MAQEEMVVTIYGLESILFEGKVKALSSVNEMGPFDILPLHINFISVIKDSFPASAIFRI